MDQTILENLFELFFSTKGVGEWTGLGLPSVYGAVKQNDGFIDVSSELGVGSVFTIYPPRNRGLQGDVEPEPEKTASECKGTILLVEDEPVVLSVTRAMIERLGYQVLSVSLPGESLDLARKHEGRIDWLIRDVVMPEMTAPDLADWLLEIYPDMKCLFISG